jgi:hypothetical protein
MQLLKSKQSRNIAMLWLRLFLRHIQPFICHSCLIFNYRWNSLSLSLSLILRPTVSRPVCIGIKHPSGAYDQIFITVRQSRVCWCGGLSLTRGRVCCLQLLLALARPVIFGSLSRGTRDHILLSQIRDFYFRRLLRLAELRWRYSTSPPHRGDEMEQLHDPALFIQRHKTPITNKGQRV